MTGQRRKTDEKALLDLLSQGDIAGLEEALGMDPGGFGRVMLRQPGTDEDLLDDDDLSDDEDWFPDDDDEDWFPRNDEFAEDDEEAWLPRPEWLHPECRSVCAALDLGTCCKYPDNPLVRVATDLAGSADRAAGRLGGDGCAESGAELARWFRMIPGLLAQIHAVLPRLNQTARAQLLCPVGTLTSALEAACGDGCPWGCAHSGARDRREDFSPMIELVAECSAAIRTALGPARASREPVPVVSRRDPRRRPGF